jgi:hypothetical protein
MTKQRLVAILAFLAALVGIAQSFVDSTPDAPQPAPSGAAGASADAGSQ